MNTVTMQLSEEEQTAVLHLRQCSAENKAMALQAIEAAVQLTQLQEQPCDNSASETDTQPQISEGDS